MAKFISNIVKALADFIEFDEAISLGTKRGALPPQKMALAEAQLDSFYQKLRAAGADETRMNDLPWDVAENVIAARRQEAKRLARKRHEEAEAARELREMLAA